MKILPLALALLATPAFAQAQAPKLRKGASSAAFTSPAAPASQAARATQGATSGNNGEIARPTRKAGRVVRSARAERETGAAKPENSVPASPEGAAVKPKKKGFFGFFARMFGGGKAKGKSAKPSSPAASGISSSPVAANNAHNANNNAGTVSAKVKGGSGEGAPEAPRPAVAAGSSDRLTRPAIGSTTAGQGRSTSFPPSAGGPNRDSDRSNLLPPPSATRPESIARPAGRSGSSPADIIPDTASHSSSALNRPDLKPANQARHLSTVPSTSGTPSGDDSAIRPATKTAQPAKPATMTPSAPAAAAASAGGEFDKARYQKVRRQAASDASVAEMGAKLNAMPAGEAQRKAARAYSSALFSKMRQIDPSQTEWFNRMEAATQRRIDAGKPFVAD